MSGSECVRTFRVSSEYMQKYLVSMVSTCSPRTLRRGIQISKCLPRLKTSSSTREEILSISQVITVKNHYLFFLYYSPRATQVTNLSISLPRQSLTVYNKLWSGLAYCHKLRQRLPLTPRWLDSLVLHYLLRTQLDIVGIVEKL